MSKFGIRQNIAVVTFILITFNFPLETQSLTCFDGSRCEHHNCNECEGVACLRIIRQPHSSADYYYPTSKSKSSTIISSEEGGDVAMTCLPSDTRTYDLEPAGCRTNPINNVRTCVCYSHDFCNTAATMISIKSLNFIIIFALILFTTLLNLLR